MIPANRTYTKAELRAAILKAAASIEAQPQRWNFRSISVPDPAPECRTQGCALGWIGAHLGAQGDIQGVSRALGHGCDSVFYSVMGNVSGGTESLAWVSWPASQVADVLRKYVDKHFPCETPDIKE